MILTFHVPALTGVQGLCHFDTVVDYPENIEKLGSPGTTKFRVFSFDL